MLLFRPRIILESENTVKLLRSRPAAAACTIVLLFISVVPATLNFHSPFVTNVGTAN